MTGLLITISLLASMGPHAESALLRCVEISQARDRISEAVVGLCESPVHIDATAASWSSLLHCCLHRHIETGGDWSGTHNSKAVCNIELISLTHTHPIRGPAHS
jgi:hypothetical protein